MKVSYQKYTLKFKQPAGTSRGVLFEKESWFITAQLDNKLGIGECGLLRGLSVDDRDDYEDKLKWACQNFNLTEEELAFELREFPSIFMGVETAKRSLHADQPFILFPSDFTAGKASIAINGLVWMGSESFMHEQMLEKLVQQFSCVKMKIGALDFESELKLLKELRERAPKIEIRVDANGAFSVKDALAKLEKLALVGIHSIEQPIATKQWDFMAHLCETSPIPIALDEELIGVFDVEHKKLLLKTIKPQYIILKPSLMGGLRGSEEWVHLAENENIGWWATSALESSIGLNAIAQWTYAMNVQRPQGLGTGSLYTNNFESPLLVAHAALHYNPELPWVQPFI